MRGGLACYRFPMGTSLVKRVSRTVGRLWWAALAMAVAFAVGWAIDGVIAVVVYTVMNVLGALLYLDGRSIGKGFRVWWAPIGTIFLLPTGFVSLLFTEGSSPQDHMHPEDAIAAGHVTTNNPGSQAAM